MITAARIREYLDRRPFRPFRVFLSDGSRHEVPHPEFAWVFGGRIFIGVPAKGSANGNGMVKELALLYVTRLEELAGPKSKK